MKMKLLIAQVCFLALIGVSYGAAIENCHTQRLTDCGDPVSEFRKKMGQSFPTTEEQVVELCENMKQAHDCAEEYQNKCMTPMQLETMGFLTEGSNQVYEEFCQEGTEIRTDYLKHAQCLDDTSKTEEAKSHYTYYEATLEDLSEKAPEKRLATACCGYQWLSEKSEEMGREKCGDEAVESYNRVVEMATSSLPSVFCSGFSPESEKCTEVLPPPGTQPKGTIKNSHIAQAFATIYIPEAQL